MRQFVLSITFLAAIKDLSGQVRLLTLDPGHFHAALVQKSMYEGVDSIVYVYAPEGPDVKAHLEKIDAYNSREKDPTHWVEKVYRGNDFFEKMIAGKAGNTVVLAGNNQKKTEYILRSLEAGLNVLADKPMVIDHSGFGRLQQAFATAEKNKLLLYDIMTERYEITSILQKQLSMDTAIFGAWEKGTPLNPAVIMTSVHRLYKYVSGSALARPPWFFDVDQQGESMVDVMTHLVDLVQWTCFPGQSLDYLKDVQVDSASHWTTDLSLDGFRTITKLDGFPAYLKKDVRHDTSLQILFNGEINYRLRGIHIRTRALWTYKAPEGAGDTYSCVLRGTKANLVIRQEAGQQYKPALYIEPLPAAGSPAAFEKALRDRLTGLQANYPGLDLKRTDKGWELLIPEKFSEGHEAHFARVTEAFLGYLKAGRLPAWETPNMIAKYYTTTRALELAKQQFVPTDTLKGGVYHWKDLSFKKETNGRRAQLLDAQTPDLSSLEIHVTELEPGKAPHPPHVHTDGEELIIIKEGRLKVTIAGRSQIAGPGGVALAFPGDRHGVENAGDRKASYYIIKYRSRYGWTKSYAHDTAGAQTAGSYIVDWKDLKIDTTDRGQRRNIFDRPGGLFRKLELHATTLDAGRVSHAPHVHRQEEIILLRKGEVEMQIGENFYKAGPGDLIFLPSGVKHALKNTGSAPCEYFALQWD